LGLGLGLGLGSHSSSHAPLLLATLLSHNIPPLPNSFVIGTAVINTHRPKKMDPYT
jgi:hypothetical protein